MATVKIGKKHDPSLLSKMKSYFHPTQHDESDDLELVKTTEKVEGEKNIWGDKAKYNAP